MLLRKHPTQPSVPLRCVSAQSSTLGLAATNGIFTSRHISIRLCKRGLPQSRWVRSLGPADQIVVWLKNPQSKPRWMSPEQFAALPNEIKVRELRYEVHQRGFRTKAISFVTTLLDEEVYTLPKLAELYHRRWEIETTFGHARQP